MAEWMAVDGASVPPQGHGIKDATNFPKPGGNGGFTLIELLIVVVIIGVLASVAIPTLEAARERAHFASITSDFRHLSQAQELYFQTTMMYGDLADLGFTPTQGVEVVVAEATTQGWAAVGTHAALDASRGCSIYLGDAGPPPLPNGQPHGGAAGTADCSW